MERLPQALLRRLLLASLMRPIEGERFFRLPAMFDIRRVRLLQAGGGRG